MDIAPNPTLYLSNLYEKLKKDEMKKCLYALFGQFGRIIDVVCMKTENLRGQAWVVFADITSATNALRSMQDFPFFNKPMRIQFSKSKSDATAHLDGTWKKDKSSRIIITPMTKTEKEGEEQHPPTKRFKTASAAAKTVEDIGTPHRILFIENLPDATTVNMLEILFQQFPGFQEARLVPGKAGIAFIEFENDIQAGVALAGLQGFKITQQHTLFIVYAKK